MLGNPDGIVMRPINVKTRNESIYCHNIEVELDRKLWFYDIKKLLKEDSYPSSADSTNRKTILAYWFFLNVKHYIEDHMVYLVDIRRRSTNMIMSETHEQNTGFK